jgi:hypothetical protein
MTKKLVVTTREINTCHGGGNEKGCPYLMWTSRHNWLCIHEGLATFTGKTNMMYKNWLLIAICHRSCADTHFLKLTTKQVYHGMPSWCPLEDVEE